jgi:hypothetical protein
LRGLTSLLLVAIHLSGCDAGTVVPSVSEFRVGLNQSRLLAQFGEPVQKSTFHKEDEGIWGEIETYWSTLPIGSTVDVWAYESRNQDGKGRTELYFLDGSTEVSEIGFSPKGVVYESDGT